MGGRRRLQAGYGLRPTGFWVLYLSTKLCAGRNGRFYLTNECKLQNEKCKMQIANCEMVIGSWSAGDQKPGDQKPGFSEKAGLLACGSPCSWAEMPASKGFRRNRWKPRIAGKIALIRHPSSIFHFSFFIFHFSFCNFHFSFCNFHGSVTVG